jgi:hypothetical protein
MLRHVAQLACDMLLNMSGIYVHNCFTGCSSSRYSFLHVPILRLSLSSHFCHVKDFFSRLKINQVMTVNISAFNLKVFGAGANSYSILDLPYISSP